VDGLTPDELLGLLARLRQAPVKDVRAPHKPLLAARPGQPAVDIA
jgi:hypothetical protein